MNGLLPVRSSIRELWGMRWRTVAVMLIMGAGFGMYAGLYSAIDSLFSFRDGLYQQANIAAHEIRFTPEDSKNIPNWSDISGIESIEQRLLLPGNIVLKDGLPLSSLMVTVTADAKINKLLITEGEDLDNEKPSEIVIDRNLARHYDYKIGDELHLNIGKATFNLTVRGIATSVEHLVDGANPNFFLPSKGSLGIVFAPRALMHQRLGFDLVNSVLFTGNLSADDLPEDVAKEVLNRAKSKLSIDEDIPLSHQFGHMFLNVDLGAFRIFTPAIVAIFAVCAVTILFFLLYQWVTRQRQQLGVFSALGYGKGSMALRVFVPVSVIAIGGTLSGIGISFVMLYGFGMEYANAIGLPSPNLVLFSPHIVWAFFGLIFACIAGVYYPLRQALKITPLSAVRDSPQAPPPDHGTSASKLSSPVWRYSIQSILRRRYASLMTVVSVALALAPALAYFVALSSFQGAIVNGFSKDNWEYAVDFLSPVWDDELEDLNNISGVQRLDLFVRGPARFTVNDKRESGLLIGVSPDNSLRSLTILEGRGLNSSDTNSVVMERKLAGSLGITIGESLTVQGKQGDVEAVLVGVFSGALPGETFTTINAARHWLDLDDQNTGVLVSANQNSNLSSVFYQDSRVGKVTVRSELVAEVIAHLKEIAGIVYLAAAFSIGVALLFLFTSSSFTFMERESDFVLLEILGFEQKTLSKMMKVEVGILGVMGIILSLPTGYVLAMILNSILGQAWFNVPTLFDWRDPVFVMIPALVLLPVTTIPVIKKIKSMTMSETLRRRSFG